MMSRSSSVFYPYFRTAFDRRFAIDSSDMSNTDWVCNNTSLGGKKFSIKGYEFQRAILDDMHPNMDVIKCSQVGLTEIQIRKALAFLNRYRNTTCLFSLPTKEMYEKVSNGRIKPIVENNLVFNPDNWSKMIRRVDQMQFGESWLYVVAAIETAATSTPADMIMNDEIDLSDQTMVALFNSRLQNSEWKIKHRFSTPTYPGYGIDLGFQGSDQHQYLVRCEFCNHYQFPLFTREFIRIPGLPDHVENLLDIDQAIVDLIDVMGATVVCNKCGRTLNLADQSLREWVPKYPGRTHSRGYRINPFSVSRRPVHDLITQLLDYKKKNFLKGFVNTVLGETYTDGNIQISYDALAAVMSDSDATIGSERPVSIGIDVGQVCHFTLYDIYGQHLFKFGSVHVDNLWTKIDELMKTYNIVCGCIDRHPYEPTADEIFEKSGGKIVPVEYRGLKDLALALDAYGNMSHAQVNRTIILDNVFKAIRFAEVRISGYMPWKETLISHFRNMVRDENPEQPATWIKLDTEDHWFHATGFALYAQKVAEVVKLKLKEDVRSAFFVSDVEMKAPKGSISHFRDMNLENSIIPW